MCNYSEIQRALEHGDFVTRIGWNDKSLAVKRNKPFDDDSVGLYKLGKWVGDYIPTAVDKRAKDWIAISDREAECGDADF